MAYIYSDLTIEDTQLVYRSLGARLTAQMFWVYCFLEPVQSLSSAGHFWPTTGSRSGKLQPPAP